MIQCMSCLFILPFYCSHRKMRKSDWQSIRNGPDTRAVPHPRRSQGLLLGGKFSQQNQQRQCAVNRKKPRRQIQITQLSQHGQHSSSLPPAQRLDALRRQASRLHDMTITRLISGPCWYSDPQLGDQTPAARIYVKGGEGPRERACHQCCDRRRDRQLSASAGRVSGGPIISRLSCSNLYSRMAALSRQVMLRALLTPGHTVPCTISPACPF